VSFLADADPSAYGESLKPGVAEVLRAVGLDVVYERAEGDRLFYRDDRGALVPVLDFLGGYGASLLGHNHPALVAVAKRVLDEQRPFNAQASVRALAGRLAEKLSERVGRTTGRKYIATFASTGAAAVEAAIKHAEMELVERIEALMEGNARVERRLRIGLRQRTVAVPAAALALAEAALGGEAIGSAEELFQRVEAHNLEVLAAGPTFLTLERGFHGKSTGALSITANPRYRKIWRRLGLRTAFLRPGDERSLEQALGRATVSYLALTLGDDGRLGVETRSLVNVVGCFVEPIQGEGGVHEIPTPFLERLRDAADLAGFPLIFDEIQCGLGRTGSFLGSGPSGVRADYYLFSKSLGGGLAKLSALLVDKTRYLSDFGLLHTSTFAEDDFASAIGLAVLDLLDDATIDGCARKGESFRAQLEALRAEYPDQIVAVRGRGLMIGVELAWQTTSRSSFLRVASEQELLGYVVAGYLLRVHGVRVAPTLSSPNTLRLQPSAFVTDEDMARLVRAMREVAEILRTADAGRLVGHLVGAAGVAPVRAAAPVRKIPTGPVKKVAFLAHFLEATDLRAWDPSLGGLDDAQCTQFFERVRGLLEPFVMQRTTVCSATGAETELTVIGIPFTAAQVMAGYQRQDGAWIRGLVDRAVELARDLRADVIGFGGYTSILTQNCEDVLEDRAVVTSGNSLTAAAAVEATIREVRRLGLGRVTVGVVGALGNIGSVLAELLAEVAHELVLVGKPAARRRLEVRAEELRRRVPAAVDVRIATDMATLRECQVVVSATNSPTRVVLPEHIGDGPVVLCDIATPGDISPAVRRERPRAVVQKGGTLVLPFGQHLAIDGMQLPRGEVYGCLAETLLTGLAGLEASLSLGALDAERVRIAGELARLHGFSGRDRDQPSVERTAPSMSGVLR
jgi:acetylornithine/succinyldiaminopimelate/putrescine aminotransferase/predicted amino acid dehydrogenase